MKPPFDLTDKAVKCYGIPQDAIVAGDIANGKLEATTLNASMLQSAWREAWERFKDDINRRLMRPKHYIATPP